MKQSNTIRIIRNFIILTALIIISYGCTGISDEGKNIPILDAPIFSPDEGTYSSYQNISISSSEGAMIHYTTDGSDPYIDNPAISICTSRDTVRISANTVIHAVARQEGRKESVLVKKRYNINGYKFFVAGHVYGRHIDPSTQIGIHPEFRLNANGFPKIKNDPMIKFGFFVEDSLNITTEIECDELDADILNLGLPVYLAPGNHDYTDYNLFTSRYGHDGRLFYSFIENHALFIVLDGQLGPWNIQNEQKVWLESILTRDSPAVDTIFVFIGKILWASNGWYGTMNVNWREWGDAEINFWPDIVPLFVNSNKPVVIFGGDVCAFDGGAFMTDSYENITFYATGMGGGENEDHYIIYSVDPDGTRKFDIIPLYIGDQIRRWNDQ